MSPKTATKKPAAKKPLSKKKAPAAKKASSPVRELDTLELFVQTYARF
jgi:hypothetical protein